MPKLTLYGYDGSCAMAPHVVLIHLGLPHKYVPMRTTRGEGFAARDLEAVDGSVTAEEYRKIHHYGFVPALKVEADDDGQDSGVITELPAVMTMIGSLEPRGSSQPPVAGREGVERAKVVEWLAWLSGTVHSKGFDGFFRPWRHNGEAVDAGDAVHAKARAAGLAIVEYAFGRIDGLLGAEGTDGFAIGGRLTAVDFFLYVLWRWAIQFPVLPGAREKYPTYAASMRRMEKLDAVRKVLEVENKEPLFTDA